MNSIQESFTDKLFANYEVKCQIPSYRNAASRNGIFAIERQSQRRQHTSFPNLILTKIKSINQKASGRCWMFAALNTPVTNPSLNTNWKTLNCHVWPHFSGTARKSNWFLEQ